MKTLQYDSQKLQFSDDANFQKGAIISTFSILILLGLIYPLSRTMSLLDIIIVSSTIVSFFIIGRAYYLRDFSKSIKVDDITNMQLKYRLNGNIILKVYNKKGKCRFYNSINNREEAEDFISFSNEQNLNLKISDYQK